MAEKKNPFAKAPLASKDEAPKGAAEVDETAAGAAGSAPADSDTSAEAAPAEAAAVEDAPAGDEAVSEAKPKAVTPKPKKLTATQERDQLREEVEALRARLDARESGEEVEVGIVEDRVLAEDGVGGTIRLLPESATVMNDDWRMTRTGLIVMIGRASAQANTALKIPASLLPSLHELTEHYLAELGEQRA